MIAGEIWTVDFGYAGKLRPVLLLSDFTDAHARALVVVLPLTTTIRGELGEVEIGKPKGLPRHSAVNLQGLASVQVNDLIRRITILDATTMRTVKTALVDFLGLRDL